MTRPALSIRAAALACAALFALPGTALAAPDLSGKSDAFRADYQAFYVACLETTAGSHAVSTCESNALAAAEAADAKRGMVSSPLPGLTGAGPAVRLPGTTSPPPLSDDIKAWQDDMQKYADYDFVIRVPVKITHFRFHQGLTKEEMQPRVWCKINGTGGAQTISKMQNLPVTLDEGDNFDGTIIFTLNKDETWTDDSKTTNSFCYLITAKSLDHLCQNHVYDPSQSLCRADRNREGKYTRSQD